MKEAGKALGPLALDSTTPFILKGIFAKVPLGSRRTPCDDG